MPNANKASYTANKLNYDKFQTLKNAHKYKFKDELFSQVFFYLFSSVYCLSFKCQSKFSSFKCKTALRNLVCVPQWERCTKLSLRIMSQGWMGIEKNVGKEKRALCLSA